MNPISKALALTISTLACAELLPAQAPEYQTNSSGLVLTIDGKEGSAFKPAVSLVWQGGQSTIHLEVDTPFTSVALLAFEAEVLKSRQNGAAITAGGHIINLPLGASFVTADITGSLAGGSYSLPIPTSAPGVFAFQALVLDASHPDGFRLSAPVMARVDLPSGVEILGSIPMDELDQHAFTVHYALGHDLSGPPLNEFNQVGTPTTTVAGTVSLMSASVGTLTTNVEVDGSGMRVLVNGNVVSTIHDIWPLSIASEVGTVEWSFRSGVTLTMGGLYLQTPLFCTAVTDLGGWIPVDTGPFWPGQDLTSQQALNQMGPALAAAITECAPPSMDWYCHSYTFLPEPPIPQVRKKAINGVHIPRLLEENGYYRTDIPNVGNIVGDVAIYSDANGNVLHSAVVSAVDGNGVVTEVTGKWSWGGVYKHAPLTVPPTFLPQGGSLIFYRSNRPGGNYVDMF